MLKHEVGMFNTNIKIAEKRLNEIDKRLFAFYLERG